MENAYFVEIDDFAYVMAGDDRQEQSALRTVIFYTSETIHQKYNIRFSDS